MKIKEGERMSEFGKVWCFAGLTVLIGLFILGRITIWFAIGMILFGIIEISYSYWKEKEKVKE